jgi:protein TonB
LSAYLDRPSGAARAVSLGVVILAHLAVIAFILAASGAARSIIPVLSPVQVLPSVLPPPPPPPPIDPKLTPPDMLPVPMPDIAVAPPPPSSRAPVAIVRVAPKGPPVSHFGAASGDTGLGVGLAVSGTGGARGRGSLGDFEAAVKRAILARKVQPFLAWDRRNTCVVNYTASVAPDGSLAGLQIDACAVREINDAARDAIRQAAPFPRPPDLGGRVYDVHGTLIFHP